MNSAKAKASSEVEAWLTGGASAAVFAPSLFGGDDTEEALESGADLDWLHALALASALAAGETVGASAPTSEIRDAPWEVQALFFSTCTHAPARFGPWEVGRYREIETLTDDEAIEQAGRWWGTLHTRSWEIASHEDGRVVVARWNAGEPTATLLRLDHELERKELTWFAELLGTLVGIESPGDRKLKKKAAAEAPAHRRAHELLAYFYGARRPADLANA